jgi:plasmid stabilization system protein ParE
MSITIRPPAAAELAELLSDIEARSQQAAAKVGQQIQRTFDLLEAQPFLGTAYPTTNPQLAGLRYKVVNRYPQFVILYTPRADGIDVRHVVRGRRNIAAILGDE